MRHGSTAPDGARGCGIACLHVDERADVKSRRNPGWPQGRATGPGGRRRCDRAPPEARWCTSKVEADRPFAGAACHLADRRRARLARVIFPGSIKRWRAVFREDASGAQRRVHPSLVRGREQERTPGGDLESEKP